MLGFCFSPSSVHYLQIYFTRMYVGNRMCVVSFCLSVSKEERCGDEEDLLFTFFLCFLSKVSHPFTS